MPLVGYHLIGFDKPPLSFSQADMRLLASDQHQQRTADFFSKTPFNFNLFFYNGVWKGRKDYLLRGKVALWNKDITGYRSQVDFFLCGQKQNAHAINFVFTNNRGNKSFNIPLTPWIMAHRMGHIQITAHVGRLFSTTMQFGFDTLWDVYGHILQTDGVPHVEQWSTHLRPYVDKPHVDARIFHAFFVHLLTTRAARSRRLTPWFEYYPEWMAQFIRFNRLFMPEFYPDLDLEILFNEPDRPLVPFPENRILRIKEQFPTTEFRTELETSYAGILRSWTGEVVVT